jgi:hypothetical protein
MLKLSTILSKNPDEESLRRIEKMKPIRSAAAKSRLGASG